MMSMTLREASDGDLEILYAWALEDPECEPAVDQFESSMSAWGLVFNGDGEPVAAVGLQHFGPVANVHVVVNPKRRAFKLVSRVYDIALEEARRRGVRHAVGLIPSGNQASLLMAHRKGFRAIPVVVMTKDLGDG